MRPRIVQTDDQIGFHWVTPAGAATTLRELVVDDDEPDRLVATHIEALDDALIIAAERFGELLGGGRPPRDQQERDGLSELHRVLDLLCFDYAAALDAAGLTADVRAGQIIGTATLFSICARRPLGLLGPAPFDGSSTIRRSGWSRVSGRCTRSIRGDRGSAAAGWCAPSRAGGSR